MPHRRRHVRPLLVVALMGGVLGMNVLSSSAVANVPLHDGLGGPRDYGTDCLSPNDDGSSAAIDITSAFPAGLRFFSGTHTQVFVNTNGNITFSGPEPVYTPEAFPVASRPMIAAYWADVDLRPLSDGDCRGLADATDERGDLPCENPSHNGTWWKLDPGRMTITWDQVGYYSCQLEKVMDFQMILTAAPQGCGSGEGDFDVEFRFNRCEWTTGDASNGSNGFGGTAAQVGFDAGNTVDFVQIPGSMTGNIHTIACGDSNVGEPGRWVFQIRAGNVVCPDSGGSCDTGLQGVCAVGRTSCVGAGTECQAVIAPVEETCNALDDDCDGELDEGALCPNGGTCDRGVCRGPCTEASCPRPDEACANVSCDAGFRCVAGDCVDACVGVACPVGTECRAGRCIDSCSGFACDECSVCVDGACEARCSGDSCGTGRSCLPDGRCVSDACASITCEPGFFCDNGACLDACAGAVCPDNQTCQRGECVDASGNGTDPAGEGEGEGEGGTGTRNDDDDDDDDDDGRASTLAGCSCDASSENGGVVVIALALLALRGRRRTTVEAQRAPSARRGS